MVQQAVLVAIEDSWHRCSNLRLGLTSELLVAMRSAVMQ